MNRPLLARPVEPLCATANWVARLPTWVIGVDFAALRHIRSEDHFGIRLVIYRGTSRAETGIRQVNTQDQRRAHVDIEALLVLQGVDKLHGRFR